jgi:hypothetical protein
MKGMKGMKGRGLPPRGRDKGGGVVVVGDLKGRRFSIWPPRAPPDGHRGSEMTDGLLEAMEWSPFRASKTRPAHLQRLQI